MIGRRALYTLILIAIIATAAGSIIHAQTPRTEDVLYTKWNFKVGMQTPYEKHALPTEDGVLVCDVYIRDKFAYIIKIIEISDDMITSTAIEQAIQTEFKAAPASAEARRWELYSRDKNLFKGLSRKMSADDVQATWARFVKDKVKGSAAYQSMSYAPLSDEASPMLCVGVIGPEDSAETIENEAKFLAFSVSRLPKAGPRVENAVGAEKSVKQPPTPKPPAQTAPVKPPAPAQPLPLKKGDIELVGKVTSISANDKSLTMTVEQIRMPGQKPIKLNPSRPKTVFYTLLPDTCAVGTGITVIGPNEGVGKPITADTIGIDTQSR